MKAKNIVHIHELCTEYQQIEANLQLLNDCLMFKGGCIQVARSGTLNEEKSFYLKLDQGVFLTLIAEQRKRDKKRLEEISTELTGIL